MENSLIHYACIRATRKYDSTPGKRFNSASFSSAVMDTIGHEGVIDGRLVEFLLFAQPGIKQIGESHWEVLDGKE